MSSPASPPELLVAVDDALKALAEVDVRLLGISWRTTARDWHNAKAFLRRQLRTD